MANLFAIPWRPVMQNNLVVAGAKIYFTLAGTNTASAPFSDSALTTHRTNPVIADGVGKMPITYLDPAKSYRVRIYSRSATVGVDTPLEEYDPYVPGVFADADALEPVAAAAAESAADAAESASAAASAITGLQTALDALTVAFASMGGSVTLADLEASAEGLWPEWFGAVGNGIANDTVAFQTLAGLIEAAGGGTIKLRPGATYLVGLQDLVNVAPDMFVGQSVLSIDGCTKPVIIEGNGAKMKFAAGLKFGTFDAAGAATTHSLPFSGSERSYPVDEGIINISNCTGRVKVSDLEIDGNDANFVYGGPYGDTGWQLPGDGLFLQNNSGGEDISNVYSHNMPRDGTQVLGGNDPTTASSPLSCSRFQGSRFEYNNRQGMSFTGGRGYVFDACSFSFTGRSGALPGGTFSAPGAGVDLEAESGLIRDLLFIGCAFIGNSGAAMVADSGDTARIKFQKCVFVGDINWSAWPNKPEMVFEDCLFVGGLVHTYSDPDPTLAANFIRCRFTDDPAFSPSGDVYGTQLVSNGGAGSGVVYDTCAFDAGRSLGGFDCTGQILRNCTLSVLIAKSLGSLVSSRFEGRNTFTCPGSLEDAIPGYILTNPSALNFNGNDMGKGSATWNPASIANGAQLTTTVDVRGAKIGDYCDAAFSLSLAGLRIYASVTTSGGVGTTGVVTVTLSNNTGGAVDLGSGTLRVGVIGQLA